MNRTELEKRLANSNIPKNAYCFSKPFPGEAFCIEHSENGKWYTFYIERGERTDTVEFETEEEACDYFFRWIIKIEGNRS